MGMNFYVKLEMIMRLE